MYLDEPTPEEQLKALTTEMQQSKFYLGWLEYHQKNPEIMKLITRFTGDVISSGLKNYSISGIINRIRWYTDVETNTYGDFKISSIWSALYAREFMRRYPQYMGFFRTRELEER